MAKPASPVWTPGAPGTEGCLGYWLLHEGSGSTVADISPSGNHGSFVGAPTWSSGPFGPQLSGFSTLDRVLLPAPATHPLNGPFPAWFATLATSSTTGQGYPLTLEGAGNDSIAAVRYNGSDTSRGSATAGRLPFFVYRGSAGSPFADLPDLNDGQPHVVLAIAYSASDRRLYWDGVEVGLSTVTLTGFGAPSQFSLGSRSIAGSSFAGALHAAAWGVGATPNPVALTADWLSGAFAAAAGGAAPELVLPGPLILDGPLPPGEHVWSW